MLQLILRRREKQPDKRHMLLVTTFCLRLPWEFSHPPPTFLGLGHTLKTAPCFGGRSTNSEVLRSSLVPCFALAAYVAGLQFRVGAVPKSSQMLPSRKGRNLAGAHRTVLADPRRTAAPRAKAELHTVGCVKDDDHDQRKQADGAAPAQGHCTWGSPSFPEEKDLGVLVDERLNTTWQCALAAQQASCALGCIPSSVGTGRGRGFCPSAPLC